MNDICCFFHYSSNYCCSDGWWNWARNGDVKTELGMLSTGWKTLISSWRKKLTTRWETEAEKVAIKQWIQSLTLHWLCIFWIANVTDKGMRWVVQGHFRVHSCRGIPVNGSFKQRKLFFMFPNKMWCFLNFVQWDCFMKWGKPVINLVKSTVRWLKGGTALQQRSSRMWPSDGIAEWMQCCHLKLNSAWVHNWNSFKQIWPTFLLWRITCYIYLKGHEMWS